MVARRAQSLVVARESVGVLVVAEHREQIDALYSALDDLGVDVVLTNGPLESVRTLARLSGSNQHDGVRAVVGGAGVVIVAVDDSVSARDDDVASGVEAIVEFGASVVLLLASAENEPSAVRTWLSRGVRSVLPLDVRTRELRAAVLSTAAGLVTIEAHVVEALTAPNRAARSRSGSEIARTTSVEQRPAARRVPLRLDSTVRTLTNREREVLALLANGLATKAIAKELGISSHTVKAHVESIFEKLGATTRAEAVAIGVRHGAVML